VSKMLINKFKVFFKSLFLSISLLLLVGNGLAGATASSDLQSVLYGTAYYDPGATSCSNSSNTSLVPVPTTAFQKQNAETIIGIDKTDNLGQAGALIGLMVGMDESHLTNLANQNVPLSEQNPNKQGDGSDGTSLGIFQQQITTNWSTVSTDINNIDAINQLMTPAYAAEAFFGSPSGANDSSALRKGLQNIANWQTMDPWVAAQAVQQSGTTDGSNYKAYQPQAELLLAQLWASSPVIPLPVAQTGGSSNGNPSARLPSITNNCFSPISCSSAGVASAVPSSPSAIGQAVACIAEQQLALWTGGAMKVGFRSNSPDSFSKYSQNRDEAWCADFASWVYNQAGYPVNTAVEGNDPSVGDIYDIGVSGGRFSYHAASSGYTPQPGDLAIHYDATQANPYYHINIVVAVSGSGITLVGGDQGSDNIEINNVSKYPDTTAALISADNIKGYVSPN